MNAPQATFEVTEVFELASLGAVVLQGVVRTGTVQPGMSTKVWVDSALYMTALIKNVEFIDGPGYQSAVGLVLDSPEPEARELWLELCRTGDLLPIEFGAD